MQVLSILTPSFEAPIYFQDSRQMHRYIERSII